MKNIFIIDDDTTYTSIVSSILKITNHAYTINRFKDGEEAIKYFIKDTIEIIPDVILLDLHMPIMDGWEFLNELEGVWLTNKGLMKTKIYIITNLPIEGFKHKIPPTQIVSGYIEKSTSYLNMVRQFNKVLFDEG